MSVMTKYFDRKRKQIRDLFRCCSPVSRPYTLDSNGNKVKMAENGFEAHDIVRSTWNVPKRYQNLVPIGHGAYGSVCSAFDQKDSIKREVAIKKLTRPFYTSEYGKRTYRELRILNHMDHENIVCLIDAFTPQDTLEKFEDVYFVTPLMGADLNSIIKTQKLLDEHVQFLVYQMLRALKYLHSADIIHRDLKPSNIAVNEDCELKILDFGLARQKDDEMTGYVATRWFRGPEIMLQWMHYNNTVDVWSVGCIMAELLTGKALFPGIDHIDQLMRIMKLCGTPDDEFMSKITSDDARKFIAEKVTVQTRRNFTQYFAEFGITNTAIDLLDKMLVMDPDRRITAVQALEHPYVKEYHEEEDEPTAPPYSDPYEDRTDVTVAEWKELVWDHLQTFEPKLSSILQDPSN